jgi:hypothetical protein
MFFAPSIRSGRSGEDNSLIFAAGRPCASRRGEAPWGCASWAPAWARAKQLPSPGSSLVRRRRGPRLRASSAIQEEAIQASSLLSSASAPISGHLCPNLSPIDQEQQEPIKTLGGKGMGLKSNLVAPRNWLVAVDLQARFTPAVREQGQLCPASRRRPSFAASPPRSPRAPLQRCGLLEPPLYLRRGHPETRADRPMAAAVLASHTGGCIEWRGLR